MVYNVLQLGEVQCSAMDYYRADEDEDTHINQSISLSQFTAGPRHISK